jgi:predicted CoA-binding protein
MENCEIPKYNATTKEIKEILTTYKHIAIVGISAKEEKPSFQVAKFLLEKGYTIYPVNPNYEKVLDLKCYKTLSEIPFSIEIVDIFRHPSQVKPIVEEAIKIGAKVIWMQEGIINNEAAELAIKNNLKVIMNKCIKIELSKLLSN